MKITEHPNYQAFIKDGANIGDNDTRMTAQMLDRDYSSYDGLKVLVVGCLEDPFANILASLGASVTGIDYREPKQGDISNGFEDDLYTHVTGDMKEKLLAKEFDLVISVSAIEHSGLGYYKDERDEDGDIKTVKNIAMHMRPKARFYVTVPVGGEWTVTYHWRRYTTNTLSRLTAPFKELERIYFNTSYRGNSIVSEDEVRGYKTGPDISVLLKLEKN